MKEDWKPGTLIYPLPAVLVSCGSTPEEYNILTVAWTGTLCTNPPMCYISVKEIISLGSHDMFIADVVNVRAETNHLNEATGKLELAETNPLVYVHGGYYELGEKIGKFGWSVEKKKEKRS